MFDDPDYRPRPARTHPCCAASAGQEWPSIAVGSDPANRWPLRGDPIRLHAAAAVLRAGDAEQIFGTRFPGEYVMTGVARLLEALADKIHEHVDLGPGVVSAATEIAEHALAYVPRERSRGARGQRP